MGGRIKYAYHYQTAKGTIQFRYDNAPHFPNLENFPHHKHQGSEAQVIGVPAPTFADGLKEIESLITIE